MTQKEKELASAMLEMASDVFGNHGCNALDEDVWDGWTDKQRQKFVKEYHEYNGDPEEYDPDFLNLPDFAVMDLLAYKLLNDGK